MTGVPRLLGRVLAAVLVTAGAGALYLLLDAGVSQFAGRAAAVATATAVTAVVFLPAYLLIERAVDHMLHRRRPAPYGVLARLAALPTGDRDLPDLAQAAEAVGTGLGARVCGITVRRSGLRDRTFRWARPGTERPTALVELPIEHGGEQVGSITVDRPTLAGLDAERRELLDAVVGNLGVVLQATRAGIGLERQLRAAVSHATEIAAARRRAVADADSERRRIERDLHDGVQHSLVALSLALGLAEHEAVSGRTAEALARLGQVAEGLDAAEAQLARTATGVSAPELGRAGLVAALRAELAVAGDDAVTVEGCGLDGGRRFAPEVEAAVYFCCLEAVNNARRHAADAPVRVRLEQGDDRLLFAVVDEGPGWDAEATVNGGRGLRNMASRMAAVGGQVSVRSAPKRGTTVEGWAPLTDRPAELPELGPLPEPGLLDQVRVAVRMARDVYHGTAYAQPLSGLARWLDAPPRIAVAAPSPSAAKGAVQRLADPWRRTARHAQRGPAAVPPVLIPTSPDRAAALLEPDGLAPPEADAVVLVVPSAAAEEAGYVQLQVLAREAGPSRTVGIVVPGSGEVGLPAALHRICGVGDDGRPELVVSRLGSRLEALRARTVVRALTELLRDNPPAGDRRPLQYELDRIRSGSHELAEVDLLDALATEDLRLPDADREAAERLLGLHGADPATRLGCGAQADTEQLMTATAEQLAHWQQVVVHPASSAGTRDLARMVVRTCERLLPVAGRR